MGRLAAVLAVALAWVGIASADTTYFRSLSDEPSMEFSDGLKVLTVYLGQEAKYPDYETQRDFLRGQGILTAYLAQKRPDDVLRKGDLSVMVVRALGIKGGLSLRLGAALGQNNWGEEFFFRRYAFKEAVFLKIMSEGDMSATVTGVELISVLTRMAEYRDTHKP